jgi:putative transcriptional regulator
MRSGFSPLFTPRDYGLHSEAGIEGTTMKKRDLFAEITEGFEALAEERAGKLTLRAHEVEWLPTPEVTADELVALRTLLHLSRSVFARYLRTNPRTLENWEQGRARPNAQAALLIRLVERYPDTVERLAAV